MANYNRTRLRSIDNTIANSYLNSQGELDTTYNYANTFSFRGRNCLSPIGDLENNNNLLVDSIDPGDGYYLTSSVQNILFPKYLNNLDGEPLNPTLMKVVIGVSRKYITPSDNGSFGQFATFTAPSYTSATTTYLVVCTPFGYQNVPFLYIDST